MSVLSSPPIYHVGGLLLCSVCASYSAVTLAKYFFFPTLWRMFKGYSVYFFVLDNTGKHRQKTLTLPWHLHFLWLHFIFYFFVFYLLLIYSAANTAHWYRVWTDLRWLWLLLVRRHCIYEHVGLEIMCYRYNYWTRNVCFLNVKHLFTIHGTQGFMCSGGVDNV